MSSTDPSTVAVIGGGIIGVSTAWNLARSGVPVVLLTEGELTSQASGRSLSWLNSAAIRSDAYHRLRLAGIDRYRTLFARQPGANWLRFDGGLAWQPAEQAADLRRSHEHRSRRVTKATYSAVTRCPPTRPASMPPPSQTPAPSGTQVKAGSICRAWCSSWRRTSPNTVGSSSPMPVPPPYGSRTAAPPASGPRAVTWSGPMRWWSPPAPQRRECWPDSALPFPTPLRCRS